MILNVYEKAMNLQTNATCRTSVHDNYLCRHYRYRLTYGSVCDSGCRLNWLCHDNIWRILWSLLHRIRWLFHRVIWLLCWISWCKTATWNGCWILCESNCNGRMFKKSAKKSLKKIIFIPKKCDPLCITSMEFSFKIPAFEWRSSHAKQNES